VSPAASHSLSRRSCLLFCFVLLGGSMARLTAQLASTTASSGRASATTPITVSGQVFNAVTGQPIPRVLVRINDRAMLTTHEGKFEFDQYTGSGNASVQVTKPGYYFSTDPSDPPVFNLTADQLEEPIEIRLYSEALMTGTVTAPDGEPIPHLPVIARRSSFDGLSHRWIQGAQGQTDSRGNFRLTLPPGDYRLETKYMPRNGQSVEAIMPLLLPEHTSSNTSGMIHIGSGEQLHFDLHPQTSRTYDVVAQIDGMPDRAYPTVIARSSNGSIIPVPLSRNGSSDELRMQLPTGTYTLIATVNGPDFSGYAQAVVSVPDHDISGVILHLTSNPGIPVELQVDGSASAASSATSDNATAPSLPQLGLALTNTQSDSDRGNEIVGLTPTRNQTFNFAAAPGSYRLQARNHGQWYVTAANYGTSDLLQHELVIGPGSGGTPIRVTVSNQTSALQGTLRLNGKSASCWLYLIPTGPSADPLIFLRSGASGSYNYTYLPPGGYQAIAFEHHYSADLHDPEILARFSTYVHAITLNPGDKHTLDLDAVPAAEMVP
jgi:hypothetical protein